MIDNDECGEVGGMIGRGNIRTLRKPAPVPLCPSQIPRDVTRARIRTAVVGSQVLTPEYGTATCATAADTT
jgi:hypothetical protein